MSKITIHRHELLCASQQQQEHPGNRRALGELRELLLAAWAWCPCGHPMQGAWSGQGMGLPPGCELL